MGIDERQIEQGIERELDALWSYAWKLTGNKDDAADLVQRTCLRALEQRDSYQHKGKLRSWLFCIEHRIWLNELRSRQIRNHRSFSTIDDTVDDGSPHVSQTESEAVSGGVGPESSFFMSQVHDIVEHLPEAQRHVILLVCVEGFSYKEAAQILGLPIGTVMSRLSRARLAIGNSILQPPMRAGEAHTNVTTIAVKNKPAKASLGMHLGETP